MCDDARLHRLWYDLRGQSMFEESFREDVAAIDDSLERMIWRIVTPVRRPDCDAEPSVTPATAYAIFDGFFQHGLIRHLFGNADAAQNLRETVQLTLPTLVEPAPAES